MNPIYLHDCHGARCGWMCTELSASVIFSVLYLCENICCSSTGRDPTVYVKCVSKSKQLHRCELPLRLAYCSNGLLGGVSKFLEGPATGQFHRVFFPWFSSLVEKILNQCPNSTSACFLWCFPIIKIPASTQPTQIYRIFIIVTLKLQI